jgi:hypothetical protein
MDVEQEAGEPTPTADEEATGEEVGAVKEPKPAPKRRRRRNVSARKAASDGSASAHAGDRTRGNVGETIYAEVTRLIAGAKMSKRDAFARVAEAQGRRVGTVSASYYRVARQRGEGRRASSSGTGSARARRSGHARGASTLDAISALKRALDQLARAVREQDREIARLTEENARYAEIASLIAGARTRSRGRR